MNRRIFVTRSFMVRGKKNYLQNQLLLMGATITIVQLTVTVCSKTSRKLCKFKPGKEKSKSIEAIKNEMLKKIKNKTTIKILTKSFEQEN